MAFFHGFHYVVNLDGPLHADAHLEELLVYNDVLQEFVFSNSGA